MTRNSPSLPAVTSPSLPNQLFWSSGLYPLLLLYLFPDSIYFSVWLGFCFHVNDETGVTGVIDDLLTVKFNGHIPVLAHGHFCGISHCWPFPPPREFWLLHATFFLVFFSVLCLLFRIPIWSLEAGICQGLVLIYLMIFSFYRLFLGHLRPSPASVTTSMLTIPW